MCGNNDQEGRLDAAVNVCGVDVCTWWCVLVASTGLFFFTGCMVQSVHGLC